MTSERKLVLAMSTSLDGFLARTDGASTGSLGPTARTPPGASRRRSS